MVLRTIELQNYRRFRNLVLEFPENILGLVGANGAGKSTIIEAIGWALYGTRATRGAKAEIRSQGAAARDVCEVKLVFEIFGTQYLVDRQLRGKNAVVEAAIYRSDAPEPLAVQEQGVNSFVEKLLGLDYRSFFASVFARQKDLSALGDMQPEERKKAINRLISIDAIDRARELASSKRNEMKNQLEGMKAVVKDLTVLEMQAQKLREDLQQEEDAEKLARKSVEAAVLALGESRKKFEALTSLRDSYLALQSDMREKTASVEATKRQQRDVIAEQQKIDSSARQLAALAEQRQQFLVIKAEKEQQEKLRHLSERLQKFHDDLAYQREQVELEQKVILRIQGDIAKAPNPDTAFDVLDVQIDTRKQEAKRLDAQRKQKLQEQGAVKSQGVELRGKRENIGALGKDSPCPVCTRPLAEHYESVVQHFDAEIVRLREAFKQLSVEIKVLDEKLEMNQTAQDKLQKEREKLAEAVALLRHRRQELQEAQNRQKREQQRIAEIQAEIAAIGEVTYSVETDREVTAQYEKLHKVHEHALQLEALVARRDEVGAQRALIDERLRALDEALRNLQQQNKELAYDEKAYEAVKQDYDATRDQLDRCRDTLAEASNALVGVRTRLQGVETEIAEVKEQLANIASLQDELQYYHALVNHFARFRQHLAGRLRPLIAARASELLRITTAGRYSLLELDEDYNIAILDQGEAFTLQRFSGGEQDLANLCLRAAISQVVAERSGKTPVQFIVLDEVFGSQDAQRQNLIMQALLQLQSQFRQILIISHVETIKEILPVVMQIEMVNPLESQVRVI